jgi:hypothetical protein
VAEPIKRPRAPILAKGASKSTASTAQPNKQLSSPFATGSGGARFENQVQAAFAVLMLTGGVVPCLRPWPIIELKLQGKYAGYETDDFIVTVEERPGGQRGRLLCQIKHTLTISDSDQTFSEVLQAALADFKNIKVFNPAFDAIALVTGPLGAVDIEHTRVVLEMARTCGNAEEFFDKINLSYFSSATKQKKLAAFSEQLKRANGGTELSKEVLWQFLKSFHLLGYDLDLKSGVTLSLLKSHLGQFSLPNIDSLWALVAQEIQDCNPHAGTVSRDTLPPSLLAAFKDRTRQEQLPAPVASIQVSSPAPSPVQFAGQHADALKTLMLAGAFDEKTPGDLEVIKKLLLG